MRAATHCPEIHGHTGLDGPVLVDPGSRGHPYEHMTAPQAMYTAFQEASKDPSIDRLVLVTTGAMTNAALFVSLYPDSCKDLEFCFMGGGIGTGNTGR